MSSWRWSAAALPIRTGAESRYPLQDGCSISGNSARPSIPYMIWSGPEGPTFHSRVRSVSQPMKAAASSVKPSRSRPYRENAASRIQV